MKRFLNASGLLVIILLLQGCQSRYRYNDLAVIAFVLITIIVGLFIVLAIYSNILRDEVSDCDEFDANALKIQKTQKWKLVNKRYPFSITKVQFGVWTVIISSSYIYLSLLKGDCAEGPINKTALVLMGIFAGTAVASTIIDKNEINDNRPRHQNAPSEGFFIDILSDDNGISLHRFQTFTWTIIAMTIYLYKVYKIPSGCLLPELSDTLLALTGISSATYVVMRSKENDPSIQEVQQASKSIQSDSAIDSDAVSGATVSPKSPLPV